MNKFASSIVSLSICFGMCLITSVCFAQSEGWQNTIHGKWKCDVAKTIEAMKAKETPDAEIDMMKEMLPGIGIEFGKETVAIKMAAGGFNQETKGTWKITDSNEEEKLMTLEVQMDGEDAKAGEVTFLSDDSMQLVTDDGSAIVFNRVEEEEKDEDK